MMEEMSRPQNPVQAEIFNELLTSSEQVFRICLGFAKDFHDAEDLVQDVYLKAYRKIDTLKDGSLGKEWLIRIAKNTCLDHRKKRRLIRFIPLGSVREPTEINTPELQSFQNENIQILKKIIRGLRKKLKEIFVLREYGHFSYREIASILGIQEGTVMSRLNRARQEVIKQFREVNHEEK